MRVHLKNQWDITHSLTPQPELTSTAKFQLNVPQIQQNKKPFHIVKAMSNPKSHRSRKQRLLEQRNTQIQKSNRLLYEKIRKIMQKGHNSQRKIQPEIQDDDHHNREFLTTAIKPLSLPPVSTARMTNNMSLRSTQSQLGVILQDRSKFAEKYFSQLAVAREKLVNVSMHQIGNYECFGWKAKVLLLNDGEYLVIRASKGKKQVTKKYIYEKVKTKIGRDLEGWVSSKLQFEI